MTRIIFSGTEVGSNRTLLESQGVTLMGLNYWGLRKRGLPKTKLWLVSEHFDSNAKVFIESGAAQADKANLSRQELERLYHEYYDFVGNNLERISGFVEFDSQVLGLEFLESQRTNLYIPALHQIVWHEDYGLPALKEMSEEWDHIAIPHNTIESVTNLATLTRTYANIYGTSFHALGSAKPDNLRQIPFATASTLSWLSPMRRGETIIWDGSKLVRYPKKMKDQARIRYKHIVDNAGLNFEKFVGDDTLEATRVAVWSYQKLEENMAKKRPDNENLSDNSEDTLYSGLMDLTLPSSDNSDVEVRKPAANKVVQRDASEVQPLPVFGYETKTIVDMENGHDVLKDVTVVNTQNTSLRQCNTCFVASNCPAFKPDNTCAFNLPVEVKTKEQLKALLTAIIEMQGQRVAFMRFSEEMNGGYADPNLSQEIDRLYKLVNQVKEMETNKEFIQITAQRQSAGGVLSAIFGDRAQALRELPETLKEQDISTILKESLE
jgi:hypothetical protein